MNKSIISAGALVVGALAGAVLVKTVPAINNATESAINTVTGFFKKKKKEAAEVAQEVADELNK